MVFDIQAVLAFSTAARRNIILNAITTRISGRSRFGVDILQASGTRIGPNSITAEIRFTTKADADDLQTFIEAQATGVNTPIAGSWLRVHSCTHDEGINVCIPSFERTW